MLPISHGIISAGGTPSLNVTLDVRAVFGAANTNPGSGNTYATNANMNILTAADATNMSGPPFLVSATGTPYTWLRASMLDGPAIAVTGHGGGTAWNGYPTSGFTTNITITEGDALYNAPNIIGFNSLPGVIDPLNNFDLQTPNSKGHSSMVITFFAGHGEPQDQAEMFYKIEVAVTENSTGRTGSAFQIIGLRNSTGIM